MQLRSKALLTFSLVPRRSAGGSRGEAWKLRPGLIGGRQPKHRGLLRAFVLLLGTPHNKRRRALSRRWAREVGMHCPVEKFGRTATLFRFSNGFDLSEQYLPKIYVNISSRLRVIAAEKNIGKLVTTVWGLSA